MWQFGSLTSCLDETIPTVTETQHEKSINLMEEILKSEITSASIVENNDVDTVISKNENGLQSNSDQQIDDNSLILANTQDIKTEVITQNPISESYNTEYGKVKIKNQTSYTLTEDMLTPDITIDNKNVLIFHTHSCESYTSSEKYSYVPTGNYRTTDLNYTVSRVGTELENYLKQYKIDTIHNTDYHDYPSYNGSYTRSLSTVENILQTNPTDIIIDLHRDAIGSRPDYAPTVKIGEDECAQIMFVIGTNDGGLWHPNWNQNLKFAIKLQQKAEEMYSGLFKPIMLTSSRYNQHTGKYASIMEVGATGNTLEQCLNSMKYLSAVMDEVLN